MKKTTLLLMLVTAIVLGVSISVINEYKVCEADGLTVCFDEENKSFIIEENASLTVYVKNNEQKDFLLSKLTREILDYKLDINVLIKPKATAWQAVYEEDVDILYMPLQEAAMMHEYLMEIDERIINLRSHQGIEHITEVINKDKKVFLPTTYQGQLFVYNLTLLESLGFDIQDVDEKNRVRELNSWDKIIRLSQAYKEDLPLQKVHSVFPFSVSEPWQFYPYLTAGNWQMFESMDASDPGFLTSDFFQSLLFVKKLFDNEWYYNSMDERSWNYEHALINQASLMSIATEWLNWEDIAQYTNQQYQYSAFPDHNNVPLAPLVQVSGLVVKDNEYPSLSHKIISVLNSLESVQILHDSTSLNLVVGLDELTQVNFDPARHQKSLAYSYSDVQPLVALEENPKVLGWDFYLQGDMFEVVLRLFEEKITTEQAQAELVELYNTWYNQYNR